MPASSSPALEFRAGPAALARIRDGGLTPHMVRVIAGAAGGPKWLALNRLDRALFGHWLRDVKAPVWLAGSSIGSWRFAAAAQRDPEAAIARLESAYIDEQRYSRKPSSAEVSGVTARLLDVLLGDDGADEILSHPAFRLNIMAVRACGPMQTEHRGALLASMVAAGAVNLLSRRALRLFFVRELLHDPRDVPPFVDMPGFALHASALSPNNLRAALLASAAIPGLMQGVRDIPGAPPGMYRDGGLLDYHMALPWGVDEGIVLFPHFGRRVLPGWFDKLAPWRRARGRDMDHVLLLRPSRAWLDSLPGGHVPDRHDFARYAGRDDDRARAWHRAVAAGQQLADEFMEAVDSGRVREQVRLLR